jgi:hypothetical protein
MATQRLGVVTVPTMDQLLNDELFLKYMHGTPRLPVPLQHGEPWRVLAKRFPDDERPPWASRDYAMYDAAYDKLCDLLDDPQYADVVLISKRLYMRPPRNFEWDTALLWCSRCRRPTVFREIVGRHPGVHTKGSPVDPDVHHRCVLCGVKLSFIPVYEPRFTTNVG